MVSRETKQENAARQIALTKPNRLSQIQFSLAMRPSSVVSQVNQPARLNLMRWRSTLLTGWSLTRFGL